MAPNLDTDQGDFTQIKSNGDRVKNIMTESNDWKSINLIVPGETIATLDHLQQQLNLKDHGAVIVSGLEALRILTLPGVSVTMPEELSKTL